MKDDLAELRKAFDLFADAYMHIFGMRNSPIRGQIWSALAAEIRRVHRESA